MGLLIIKQHRQSLAVPWQGFYTLDTAVPVKGCTVPSEGPKGSMDGAVSLQGLRSVCLWLGKQKCYKAAHNHGTALLRDR